MAKTVDVARRGACEALVGPFATVALVPRDPARPVGRRRFVLAVIGALALAATLSGCGQPGPPETLTVVPTTALDRGVLWQRDGDGLGHLLSLLDLSADGVVEAAVSGPPRLVVLAHPDAAHAVVALTDSGYAEAAEGAWTVLTRPDGMTEATVGVPAVAVDGDLVVIGSPAEVAEAVNAAADPQVPVPADLLSGADIALLGTPTAAAAAPAGPAEGRVVDHRLHLLTGTDEGTGTLAVLADAPTMAAPTQQDAVDLAVRLATALLPDGFALTNLVEPGGPLADGDMIVVDLSWLADPSQTLRDGLRGGLLGVLRP